MAATGPVGIAIAAVAAGAVILGVTIKKMTDVFRGEAEKLQGWSVDVAVAKANTEIRKELGLMNRAQQIGPQVARWETSGSKMDSAFDRLGTQLLKGTDRLFGGPVQEILEAGTNILDLTTKLVDYSIKMYDLMGPVPELLSYLIPLVAISKAVNTIADIAGKAEEDEGDPMMASFLGGARAGVLANMPIPGAAGVGAGMAQQQPRAPTPGGGGGGWGGGRSSRIPISNIPAEGTF